MTVSPNLDRRFREAATTLGLIDVGFDVVDSPIGELFVAASDRGLAAISFDAGPGTGSSGSHASPGRASCARRGVSTLLAASSRSTSTAAVGPSTSRSTCAALPPFTVSFSASSLACRYGETTTYGELAQRVGHPRAARAVGR